MRQLKRRYVNTLLLDRRYIGGDCFSANKEFLMCKQNNEDPGAGHPPLALAPATHHFRISEDVFEHVFLCIHLENSSLSSTHHVLDSSRTTASLRMPQCKMCASP